MKHTIDLATWNRRDHFNFFNSISHPIWTVTVQLDCTRTYQQAKSAGRSFYLSYLHKIVTAANRVEAFRRRIEDNKTPVLYDQIGVSPTFPREDGTFGCAYFAYFEDQDAFAANAKAREAQMKLLPGFCPDPEGERPDAIYFSALPWFHFTSLVSENNGPNRGIPNMSVGKVIEENGRKIMPLSIGVHHAVVDGRDVGDFVETLQKLLNE